MGKANYKKAILDIFERLNISFIKDDMVLASVYFGIIGGEG